MMAVYNRSAPMLAALLLLLPSISFSFVPRTNSAARSPQLAAEPTQWLDVLKWDGAQPDFDVLELAKKYTAEPGYKSFVLRNIPTDYYSKDYIFRGPIVGPFNREDLIQTNNAFAIDKSFPDLDRQTFGYAIDPENPFRVLFFERWKATHTGECSIGGTPITAPATGNSSISPVMPFSITFNPEGKIVYETLTTAVDRFEGNTMGKVAVFGLLETAGISLDNNVGDPVLVFQQKLNRFLNGIAQTYSKAEDVPRWWKSKAVAAEKNDM
mmetsp:Transcript_3871/g.8136  ORF Transcript_3871/g.8136 Transcript_3871/m.8136 type:complete len:268 (-) Transcript_3871:95-898(-)